MKKLFLFLLTVVSGQALTAQNVGIGTTTPTEKLQVTGNIKADTIKPNGIQLTTNAGEGKILISDAAGVGTWRAGSSLAAAGNIGYGVWGDCATNGNISEYQPVTDAAPEASSQFGSGVSVSGNFALVASHLDNVGANSNQGSANIYQWNGNNWELMQKITDPAGEASDLFGSSVAISGNYAIVGADNDDVGTNTNQGSAIIFQWNGSNWVFMQKITDLTGEANDLFGSSVSISGNYAIIGAEGDDVGANNSQGSVCIYQYNGSNWVLMQKITDPSGEAGDGFGCSVAISGSYAIVGASDDNVNSFNDQGSAIAYLRFGNTWTSMGKITDVNGNAGDGFGISVSISGSYAIIGAYADDVGTNADQGSASIYKRNGTSWDIVQRITEASGSAGDLFGISVSISDDYAIVGASAGKGVNGNPQGTAAIYLRVGLGWQLLQKVTDPGSLGVGNFGAKVAVEGNTKRFLVGSPNYTSGSGKVLFGKIN